MRRAIKTAIGHAIRQLDIVCTSFDFDAACQFKMLTEHGSLCDDTLAPEITFIAFPALTIASQLCRNSANTAMNGVLDRLARLVIIMVRHLVIHEEDMVQTACHHQAGERTHPAKTALALIFMQSRMTETRRRMPADSHATIVAVGNIERAIN